VLTACISLCTGSNIVGGWGVQCTALLMELVIGLYVGYLRMVLKLCRYARRFRFRSDIRI
jgi:hypothetical protein